MRKQIIITLHTFIEFIVNNNINIINKKQIINLIEMIFDKILYEQNKQIKESIQILKDKNDFDECQMYLQYKLYIKSLENIWNYLCNNLNGLICINNNNNKLPKEYQQMILKLFNLFQKYCVFNKQDNDKKQNEEIEIPTNELLKKIDAMKQSKKRKKNHDKMEMDSDIQPPSKKRKLSSNSTTIKNINNTNNKNEMKENDSFIYGKEIILWSIMDDGCVLLSKLFCCNIFYDLGWDIVQYLILQFLAQEKKQKNSKKHIIYGWRRILGCWLISDCYGSICNNNLNIKNSNNTNKIVNVINKLNNITQNSIYSEYDEFMLRRKMIKHNTNNLILTFKNDNGIYNAMNKYFNNLEFNKYVEALTCKYNEWNNGSDDNERDNCYKLLLSSILNAQYALDSHMLLLKCSISNILINNGNVLNMNNIESVFEPILSGLSNNNKRLNLQYRCGESLAFAVKLLSDNNGNNKYINILNKIYNNIIMDCINNIKYVPRDNTRMIIQCVCDIFNDKIFDKLPFMINKIQNILMDYNHNNWIPIAQIFACFISSIKCKNIRNKYLKPLIEDLIINGIYIIDKDEENKEENEENEDEYDNVNYGICAQSRYCILQYLYQEPNIILPLIINKSIPKLYSNDIFDRLCCIQLIWDILYSIDNIKYKQINEINQDKKCQRYNNYSEMNLKHNKKILLMQIIPYLSSLIVPLLRSMTDFNYQIRKKANQIFSISVRLIPLLPLDDNKNNNGNENENKHILKQLINPSLIDEFKCPFKYNGTLRDYQQDGINWLWFLHKFNLHGILADDMGLGKTLQTILIITASYYNNNNNKNNNKLPSLIICPSTLLYHWLHEINTFIPNLLIPFIIDGNKTKRKNLYNKLETYVNDKNNNNIICVIISYNTIKNDMEYINKYNWNYCVLDEGHLIKNPKTKIAICVKKILSKYRLILSGTPIQNNVLDLWSLFDFLMPGYLGNQLWFKKNFSQPIIASYKMKAKNNNNKQRLGAIKLESLHKQVLPFIMRRLKSDVLKELPPKIIQDIEVNMSDIQKILYKNFINCNKFKNDIQTIKDTNTNINTNTNTNALQSLMYMRKLVVHPKLIMTKEHPLYNEIITNLQYNNLSLECIDISPKFGALKSLIEQCNIDCNNAGKKSEHRMLIFVQHTKVIELIEKLLLNVYYPDVKYLTLTGKLNNSERFDVIKEFNKKDSLINILLLTVKVGGLGLNLNTADIVVFMEHDWNPMKDLQAMDRAHRIGQTKTVHVFRIIVRNTIEWEIMNKQKFKQHIANTIISKENKSLYSITNASGSILDLFYNNNVYGDGNNDNNNNNNDGVDVLGEVHQKTKKQKALDSMLDSLGNMTSINEQYQNEYDLKKFISDLK